MANQWLTGEGTPSLGIGQVTDYYRDTVNNLVYYRENSTTWANVPAFTPNPDGIGTTWLHGDVPPLTGQGSDGDYYYDEVQLIVYRKDGATWVPKGSLDFIGIYGVQWGNGSGAPANTTPLNNLPAGSFYLDVETSNIYFKPPSMVWELKGQLGGGGGSSIIVEDTLTSDSHVNAASVSLVKTVSDSIPVAEQAAKDFSIQRANHTGTQLAATISDFNTAASAAAPVQSVFGRTGEVTAQSGDYTAAQVTNAQSTTNLSTDTSLSGDAGTYPNSPAVKAYVDARVAGLLQLRGGWDASSNLFPTTGGSGTGGAVVVGDTWYVTVAGTLGSKAVVIGDGFFANINTPAQTAANWTQFEANAGFTSENVANKSDDTALASDSSTKYTTEHAVKGYVAATSATVQSGTICTTNPSSPVTMSGLYSRSYTITANTTFDLAGWVADAYTLTIRNDSANAAYTVTLNGVTGVTFLLEGGVGGAQGNIGAVTTSITLRAGETIEVRVVGTNVYRVRSSFQSWNFMGDFKIRSTYTSGLKAISFSHASGAAFTTDCAITVPNVATVNLGKIPTALSYSGSTLTQTTTDGLTLTTTITKPVPTKQTTSFAFASSNIVCRWESGVTGAKTVTLPSSPLDGDTVELWDNEEASVYGSSGITTLTIYASASTYILANPLTSYDVLSGVGGVAGMALRFVYRSATQVWSVQYFYADRFNSLDWYLEDGTNSARSMKYSLAALTAQRTITVPDANVNLGKIPTALSYSAGTDVLTHTNTDGTTLTATIKTIRSLDYALSDQTTAITTGTPLTCRVPYAFTITSVKASLKTAQASGSLFTLDIKKNGTSIFSTLLTFDNTEKTTATAATAAVLSSTTLADDDELTFIVTQVGDGTAIGLVAYIVGYPT